MLSLKELKRAARIVEADLSGAALRRVTQSDSFSLLLTFEDRTRKTHLLLSCRPEYARVCFSEPAEKSLPGSFHEYLRAHLTGGTLVAVESHESDRQIGLRFRTRSETYVLMLSILGTRSNVYLLNAESRLVHALRPLEDTRRELSIGEVWTNPRGGVPAEGADRWEEVPDHDYLDAIGRTYEHLERIHEADQLRRRIEQALRKERSFLERKSVNLREDLGEAHQAESYKRKGELLKSVLHGIRPGDDKVSAMDYETGEMVEIPLDPKLSPAANLEACFARYQKVSRGAKIIEQQIEEIESSLSELDRLENQLKNVSEGEDLDLEALDNLASEPAIQRLLKRYAPKQKAPVALPGKAHGKAPGKKEIPTRLQPKKYRTEDGLEIWVGRSDEGNDYLTTRLARGNDLFFHLDGYPGSHVILRTEGRTDPPQKSILDACELAVHFSKMKNAGTADVHVAPVKDVKKPKGAKPGLVYVRSGKTIHLRRDPRRLESILASRS